MSARFGALLLLAVVGGRPAMAAPGCGRRPAEPPIRAVVVVGNDEDPAIALRIHSIAADTMVSLSRPSAKAAAAAVAAGLRYVPFLSVADVDRLWSDPLEVLAIRALPGLLGFQYLDESAVEGYTTPDAQRRTYAALKTLFPALRVFYAVRLDLIAIDANYLDGFYRPEFTDVVAPYFYPVGTTTLGAEAEEDLWSERLAGLLAPLAARTPPNQSVLPVLQSFEQEGFPVSSGFERRQFDVYRRFWPDNENVAAFDWSSGDGFLGLSQRPLLLDGFGRLLGDSERPAPCAVPFRGP